MKYLEECLDKLYLSCEGMADKRSGRNLTYSMGDMGMSAFSLTKLELLGNYLLHGVSVAKRIWVIILVSMYYLKHKATLDLLLMTIPEVCHVRTA